ncbi:SDR family oxidoreductase [Chloroflexota bacterium]
MERVLVAGTTGYLGRYVVREFKKRGYWVRALVRNPKKLEQIGTFLQPAVIDKVNEVFVGEVTKPETLKGLCDNIDIVFSSIGITRQKDRLTYREVDYQGNKNILDIALAKSIKQFIYVSVFNANIYVYLEIVKAHEEFVKELQNSGLVYTIIRPTGYFSDMTEFLKMAKLGRAYLVGNGANKINPIHGDDLSKVCVDAVTSQEHEIAVGGPVIYSTQEIAELAFSTLGKTIKIVRIPFWLAKATVKMIRPFNRQMSDLAEFFVAAGQGDGVAPASGVNKLEAYFEEIDEQWLKEGSTL